MERGVLGDIAESRVVESEVFTIFCYYCVSDLEHEEGGGAHDEWEEVAEADGDRATPVRAQNVVPFWVSAI